MDIATERVDGVAVDRVGPPSAEAPALLLVNGGQHGSWCFAPKMRRLAKHGWESLRLNWLGRRGSGSLADGELGGRSILDARDEIGRIAQSLPKAPILVGHIMVGLACLAYAAEAEIAGLILLAPVVPGCFADEPIDLPVDPTVPWDTPPPHVARALFWSGVTDEEAAANYERLLPESPAAVLEAARWADEVAAERAAG